MLIGGTSKTHKLSKDVHAVHIKAAKTALASGRSLLLTTSRRTPDWAVAEYRELASQENQMWFYEGGEPNPYFAFLGAAETILVTEDSTNMLTEACTAGKSVLTLPMDGTPGKFEKLYSSLRTRCNVMRFDDTFKTPDYPALSETNRAAQLVLDRLEKAGLATA
jgi:mitochondrial fission protein ELM1